MARYAVGDIQGCLKPLQCLLDEVRFDPARDELWSVGDLVNRGPQSLETLRYLKSLGIAFKMVLGNHDLHLLAIYFGESRLMRKDTLREVLEAPDCHELCQWLLHQPLFHMSGGYALVHAGIPSIWSLTQAEGLSREVEAALQGPNAKAYFNHMYGNTPVCWSDDLEGQTRLRVITNYLTRMRFCDQAGNLELSTKGPETEPPAGFAPWYSFPVKREARILFGHWASLEGRSVTPDHCALDTGCVWGERMRLLDMEMGELHHCDCG